MAAKTACIDRNEEITSLSTYLLTLENKTGQTDRQTDGRQTATLRLPLDSASVISSDVKASRPGLETLWPRP